MALSCHQHRSATGRTRPRLGSTYGEWTRERRQRRVRAMANRFVLGVDLDGVVADFYGFMRNVAAEWLGVPVDELTPEVTYGLSEWGITPEQYTDMHRFAVTQRGLFRKMQVIEGAAPALRRLSDAEIHIRIITHRLYIEDAPDNVDALRAVAPTIVFTNSTNRDLAGPRANDWVEAERLVLEERGRWEQRREPEKEVTGR